MTTQATTGDNPLTTASVLATNCINGMLEALVVSGKVPTCVRQIIDVSPKAQQVGHIEDFEHYRYELNGNTVQFIKAVGLVGTYAVYFEDR